MFFVPIFSNSFLKIYSQKEEFKNLTCSHNSLTCSDTNSILIFIIYLFFFLFKDFTSPFDGENMNQILLKQVNKLSLNT